MPGSIQDQTPPGVAELDVAVADLHWWLIVQRLVPLALICLILAIVMAVNAAAIGAIAAAVVFIALAAGQIVQFRNARITLTTRRITIQSSAFSRTRHDLLLNRIEAVTVRQSLLGRLMGFGEIVLSGVGGDKDCLPFLREPEDFRLRVAGQIQSTPSYR